jgi:hypothetical protein
MAHRRVCWSILRPKNVRGARFSRDKATDVRHYAKRQLTWFRLTRKAVEVVQWFLGEETSVLQSVLDARRYFGPTPNKSSFRSHLAQSRVSLTPCCNLIAIGLVIASRVPSCQTAKSGTTEYSGAFLKHKSGVERRRPVKLIPSDRLRKLDRQESEVLKVFSSAWRPGSQEQLIFKHAISTNLAVAQSHGELHTASRY